MRISSPACFLFFATTHITVSALLPRAQYQTVEVLYSAKMESSKKFRPPKTRKLISEFEDLPCLWDIFSKDYRNNDMKAIAVKKLPHCLC
jgi:hypothetical protein